MGHAVIKRYRKFLARLRRADSLLIGGWQMFPWTLIGAGMWAVFLWNFEAITRAVWMMLQ